MPTHAHIMVAGWLMSAVFAFFYHLFPAVAEKRLAIVHFWLTAISGIGLLIGLYIMLAGNPAIEPLVATSSMGFYRGIAAVRLHRTAGGVESRTASEAQKAWSKGLGPKKPGVIVLFRHRRATLVQKISTR